MRMKSILALSLLALTTTLSPMVAAQQDGEVCDVVQEARHWWPSFLPAFSAPCCIDDHNFLLGAEFAYGMQRTVFTTDFVAPLTPPPINNYVHYDATVVTNGFLMGLLTGWQLRYQRVLWGFEANLDLTTNYLRARNFTFQDYNLTNQHWFAGTVTYERGAVFGLTTRLGYFVTPGFLPYLRIGAQTSRDTATYQVYEGNTVPTATSLTKRAWDVSSHKKRVIGVVLGVGAEFPAFIGPSTVRIEYNFTQNQNLTITDNILPITGTHNFQKPYNNILKAAWVWNFV